MRQVCTIDVTAQSHAEFTSALISVTQCSRYNDLIATLWLNQHQIEEIPSFTECLILCVAKSRQRVNILFP